jgi:hypothetical protein
MRMHWLSVLLVVFAMTSMMPVEATACVTKSGKDCDTAAAHKVVYTKKLIKLAPAGGVGKKIHSTGFDTLGTPTFRTAPTAPPDPQQYFGTNPDGWFYLMPSSQHTGGFFDKPMPHQVMAMISANAERTGGEALVNQDGSLTQYALNIGWERTGSAVPFAVTQPAPTACAATSADAAAIASGSIAECGHRTNVVAGTCRQRACTRPPRTARRSLPSDEGRYLPLQRCSQDR